MFSLTAPSVGMLHYFLHCAHQQLLYLVSVMLVSDTGHADDICIVVTSITFRLSALSNLRSIFLLFVCLVI